LTRYIRLFGWLNRATMGSYRESVDEVSGTPDVPDLTRSRRERSNTGVVLNIEQSVTGDLGLFSRASWSPGRTEIIGWTDVHDSLSFGAVLKGTAWGRPDDRIGIAGLTQGLSKEAQRYFAAGGLGIVIGDGQLNYRRENLFETYYALALTKWATFSLDYQFVVNPAYNADRGPVSLYATRVHVEF
jgi:high affinity Mn2+ porin